VAPPPHREREREREEGRAGADMVEVAFHRKRGIVVGRETVRGREASRRRSRSWIYICFTGFRGEAGEVNEKQRSSQTRLRESPRSRFWLNPI
jgi:hypothetical protein